MKSATTPGNRSHLAHLALAPDRSGGAAAATAAAQRRARQHSVAVAARAQLTRLAREAADRFATPDRPRFVAGSIGPTGLLPSSSDPTLGNVTFEELADLFEEQARPLVEAEAPRLLAGFPPQSLDLLAPLADGVSPP